MEIADMDAFKKWMVKKGKWKNGLPVAVEQNPGMLVKNQLSQGHLGGSVY